MSASIEWTGVDNMVAQMTVYTNKVQTACRQVADYFAPVVETYAKQNAPWTDRTGNARQSLHAWVEELAKDTVYLYLSHGVEYGKWLEVANAGKYSIIYPTLQAHFQAISDMLKGIFG